MDDPRSPADRGPLRTSDGGATHRERSDHAVLLLDASGTVLTWTDDAQGLYQYSATEVVGLAFSALCPTGRSGKAIEALAAARDQTGPGPGVQHPARGWCRRRDQTRFWAELV